MKLNNPTISKSPLIFFVALLLILIVTPSCKKDEGPDPRLKYVGDWNFKQTNFSFSGYYDYNVPPGDSPIWTSNTTTNIAYNDSTGTIELGSNDNELIIRYGSSASPRVVNLSENSDNSWTLTETDFVDHVVPPPPGYSSYYSTVTVEGEKL